MNISDVVNAIDINYFLDRLEESSNIDSYYRINHLSLNQKELIALKMAETLTTELEKMGFDIE